MMTAQSIEFIIGYVFAKMENCICKHSWSKGDTLVTYIDVPKIWFGLSSSSNELNDIHGDVKFRMAKAICERLNDEFSKLKVSCEKVSPEKQYIAFDFKVSYRETAKKMTLAEIESMLGYKIEIVSNDQ